MLSNPEIPLLGNLQVVLELCQGTCIEILCIALIITARTGETT